MGLDPQIVLASSVQAQPGVYALLLGSGVSRAAEIPTGWDIVRSLVRRAAAAADPTDPDAPEHAVAEPEAWWAHNGDGEALGYSNLIASLGVTAASRRDLVAGFFEPTDEERETGAKQPTDAHRAIAKLVRQGYVRVIVTTNFDRLMERALEDESVAPTVISRPEAYTSAAPLAHAAVTIIKLHGDYADLDMKNTLDELDQYPPEWEALLDRLNEEYGLIIAGWSADWDRALVRSLEHKASRRYPLFWDSRSGKGERATALRETLSGVSVPAASADALFTRLLDNVDAISRLSESPISAAVALARLKRYLPDPQRHIDLEELVLGEVGKLVTEVAPLIAYDNNAPNAYQQHLETLRDMSLGVVGLLATGVFYDRDETHIDLWVESLQRLMDAREQSLGIFVDLGERSRHFPAMLALRAMGFAARLRGHDATLIALLQRPTWRNGAGESTADYWLHDYSPLNFDLAHGFSRWGGGRPHFPISQLLREDLRSTLAPLAGGDARYDRASSDYEYVLALIQASTDFVARTVGIASGLYVGYGEMVSSADRSYTAPAAESRFLQYAASKPADSPLILALGGQESVEARVIGLRVHLASIQRY